MTMRIADFLITAAYFSIPVQILASLWKYPRLADMSLKLLVLLVLFALFIFLCGTGHLMRGMDLTDSNAFRVVNYLTAFISILTALYLLPLIPNVLALIDQSINDSNKMHKETVESKAKLLAFMSFLCHEIRNPLFVITSSVQFLSDAEMSAEQASGVRSIQDASMLMLRLVNDVLDLSKLEAGKLSLESRDFDFRQLIETMELSIRQQIEQQHHDKVRFKVQIHKEVPHKIHGDSSRLLQVTYNLLTNACKFVQEGSINLSVHVLSEKLPLANEEIRCEENNAIDNSAIGLLASVEEGNSREDYRRVTLQIVVSDTGCGIAPDRVETIFKPYSQAKLSDYREHGGTGLGLSIVSSLLHRMNGKITVQSVVDQGSTFTVTLPVLVPFDQHVPVEDVVHDLDDPLDNVPRVSLRQPVQRDDLFAVKSLPSSPTSTIETSISTLRKTTSPPLTKFSFPCRRNMVLVTDDNLVNRKMIGKMLSHYNVEFETAVNGKEAVKKVRESLAAGENETHYGMILMDLQMPVMDGFDAMRALRSDGCTIPIIALTANALAQERQTAQEAGANEFHTKPILREDLHSLCQRYLQEMKLCNNPVE